MVLNRVHAAVAVLVASVAGAGTAVVGSPAVAAPSQDVAGGRLGRRVHLQRPACTRTSGQADKLVAGRLDGDVQGVVPEVRRPRAAGTVTGAELRLVTIGEIAGDGRR